MRGFFYNTIRKVAPQTFAKRTDTKSKENNNKVNALKRCVVGVLSFLSLQSRPDFELDELFRYEN